MECRITWSLVVTLMCSSYWIDQEVRPAFSKDPPLAMSTTTTKSNTILDAEIQGFIALNKQLIDQGLASRCRIGIITFNGSHTTFLFPSSKGPQSYTAPSADQNGNGALDVDEALRGLRSGGDTQFGGALTAAEAWFKSMKTAAGNANLVFVSDGEPKDKNYQPVVARLRSEGVTMIQTRSIFPACIELL